MTHTSRPAPDEPGDMTEAHATVPVQPDFDLGRTKNPALAGSGVLVITRGQNEGDRFLLTDSMTVLGRDGDCGVFLDDVTVSRRHAELRYFDGEYWVVDAGSLNGTYVNRKPVHTSPLTSGDEIQIGKFRLSFICQPEPGADR
jgi:pSer/pThr/pTyr-binding forkhead associated (FHA) protein